jgi:hypothetical protein
VSGTKNMDRVPDEFRFVYQGPRSEIKGEWYTMHPEGVYRPNSRFPVIRAEFRVRAELDVEEMT